jgi:hypothetical protein
VYNGDSRYSASIKNLSAISLSTDNIFSDDNAATQMATVTGNLIDGFAATLTVGVSV